MVGSRTIRATLPGAELDALERAAGRHAAPSGAARRSCSRCADSDAAIRALLAAYPEARDIEISGGRARGGVPRS